MVDIDQNEREYSVRFKEKDKRKNQRDDKFEILRSVIGLRDTNNVLDLVKESRRTVASENKNNPNITKDHQTIVDINLYQIPSVHIKLTPEQAAKLRRHPDIRWVIEDAVRKADAESIPWGITRVAADKLNPATRHRGYGVKVGIIDSGIDFNHTDLKPNYKGGVSFIPGNSSPMDDFNFAPDGKTVIGTYHGTHVSGTVAAAVNNFGVVGVAPDVFLYAVKVLDKTGFSVGNSITQGMIWGNENKMDTCNMSLSGTGFAPDEADAMQLASNESRFMSCSSGNNNIVNGGKPEVRYPAGLAGAWANGATDNTDTITDFSTWGPVGYVDFVGPGKGVISDKPGNTTQSLDGTSMSTPHVTGMYALGLANYRFSPCDTNTYPPNQRKLIHIVGAMISSCDTLGVVTPGTQDAHYGFGMPISDKICDILLGQ